MGLMVVNFAQTTPMDNTSSCRSRHDFISSSTKTERRVIEKNRRTQMKTLYSKLNSLLPNHHLKEAQPLPDQIDEAINYIKNLEEMLKKSKEKKESIATSSSSSSSTTTTTRKRSYTCTSYNQSTAALPKSPQLKIQEMGSALEVVLISGVDSQFIFYEVIRILHEEGVEVVTANFQVLGDSIFNVLHAQMKESGYGFGAAKVTERLNMFINGSTSETELDSELWDLEMLPETWEI